MAVLLDLDMQTLQDYSGNGYDGSATGTTLTTDEDGNLNKARLFVRSNSDNIDIPVGAGTGFKTVGIVFKKTQNEAGDQRIVDIYKDNSNKMHILINSSGVVNVDWETGNTFRGTGVIGNTSDSNWHTLITTTDGVKHYVWYDGVLIDSVNQTVVFSDIGTPVTISLGSFINTQDYFSGSLAKVTIWSDSFTEAQAIRWSNEIKHNYISLFE